MSAEESLSDSVGGVPPSLIEFHLSGGGIPGNHCHDMSLLESLLDLVEDICYEGLLGEPYCGAGGEHVHPLGGHRGSSEVS